MSNNTLKTDRERAAHQHDRCARCRHIRLGHFKDGCHDIHCAIYVFNGKLTAPPLCTAFIESNGGNDATEEIHQADAPVSDPQGPREEDDFDPDRAIDYDLGQDDQA